MKKVVLLLKNFGEKLRWARTKRKLTTIELAKLSKLSQPYITQIENSNRQPSAKTLIRLAKALDIPGEFFLRDDVMTLDEFVVTESLKNNIDKKRYTKYFVVVDKAVALNISPAQLEEAVDFLASQRKHLKES